MGEDESTGPMWYLRFTKSEEPSYFFEVESVFGGGSFGFVSVYSSVCEESVAALVFESSSSSNAANMRKWSAGGVMVLWTTDCSRGGGGGDW